MSHIPNKAIPHAQAEHHKPERTSSSGGGMLAGASAGQLAVGGALAVGLALAAAPLFRRKPATKGKKKR